MPRAGFNISLTFGLINYHSRILRIETMIWTNKKLIAKVNFSFHTWKRGYICGFFYRQNLAPLPKLKKNSMNMKCSAENISLFSIWLVDSIKWTKSLSYTFAHIWNKNKIKSIVLQNCIHPFHLHDKHSMILVEIELFLWTKWNIFHNSK